MTNKKDYEIVMNFFEKGILQCGVPPALCGFTTLRNLIL